MRAASATGLLTTAAVVLALAYVVARTATGLEDWLELAAVFAAVGLLGLALKDRPTSAPKRKRAFRRTPESQW